ncbi:DUF1501 domain-containing protein [Vibrio sp. WXL103]|uniref:DUF1501 domain-containing protein n=1 Tax=Vibrio sp. WXL103 TaxID=3450710 RepID=UPI003EC5F8EB
MQRRNFVKALIAGGAYLQLGGLSLAWAAQSSDHYFVNILAGGGWDTTSLCDPKGDILHSESRGVINKYSVDAIRQAGRLRYAPLLAPDYTGVDQIDAFFQNHYSDIRVFNGVNGGTNAHPVGQRLNRSGDSGTSQPDTAALMGALKKETKPLAYYLGSGSTTTAGTVAATRLSDVSILDKLANPNRYLSDTIGAEIAAQHQLSSAATQAALQTNADHQAMSEYLEGHANAGELNPLLDALPSNLSSGSLKEAEIAAAAFGSGMSNSALITIGGFDTHGSNDSRQHSSLMKYFATVNHLITELERHGIADRTTILLSSDFGRTPYYNVSDGKDHWTVGSSIVWSRMLPGNRVIGATNGQLKPVKINSKTLEPDENGVELTPAHLHLALRKHLGISDSPLDKLFPLSTDFLDLLS